MDIDVEIEPIVKPLIHFLHSNRKQPPREFNIILENNDYIQHNTISIFLAKVIRFIESNNINLNLMDNTRTALPPSVYYGIIHPSSDIRRFCRSKMGEKHTKCSFTNLGDYTNIIQPIIKLIQQNLSFMRYTHDTEHFDNIERATKPLESSIQSIKNGTNDGVNIQLVESHLYSGLKLLIEKLSDNIINNHLLSSSDTDLWNILLSRIDIDIKSNEDRNILSNCCCVLRRILKCSNRFLLWEHRHLLIPNINQLIKKLCDVFMHLCEFPSQKLNVHKEVILMLEVAVQSKEYIQDDIDDIALIHGVLDCLLTKCWKEYTVSQIGYYILNIAFRIIGHFVCDDGNQHIVYSLMNQWSKTCVNFAIAGNIDDDDADQDDVRRRLSIYFPQITYDNIITLQSNKVTTIVSQSLMTDTKNVTDIVQSYLFSTRYLRKYKLNISSYRAYNALDDSNDDLLYQNNALWRELLSTDIDPWNYPASIHKLMFEMYSEIAIWDQLEKYPFRDPNDDSFMALRDDNIDALREYFAVYNTWISRIKRYFDIVANNPELAVSVFCGSSVLQYLISSYLLSGNDEIKSKMNDMIHSALNLEEENSNYVMINESLAAKDLKLILRHCVMHKKQFLRFFVNDNNEGDEVDQTNEYNQFVHYIVDGVMMSIELFKKKFNIISEIPTLFKDNPRAQMRYFFPVKEHIVSIIANICAFIDYFRSNNIKWEQYNKLYFSEIIFTYSKSMDAIIDYVLLDVNGIFGCSVGEFIRNRYFDGNKARIKDLVRILSFLANHWNKYIFEKVSFDHKYLFDWFAILKYPEIGKEWIKLIVSITANNAEIRDRFTVFSNNENNKNNINEIVNECFDLNKIKMHQQNCANIKCSEYHLIHRKQFNDLLNWDWNHNNHNMISNAKDNDNDKSTKPLKKKPKKTKQFKITEYYSSPSVTPGGSPLSNDYQSISNQDKCKVEVEADSTPRPKSFMNTKPIHKVRPFRVLDKQLFAADNKLMYYVDYTDASRNGPDWKYRKEIMDEFGIVGREIMDKWNMANKDKEIETMWGVQRILNKRVNREKGGVEYQVLWDTPSNEITWETTDNLETCQTAIQEFERERAISGKKRTTPPKPNPGEPVIKKRRLLRNHSDSEDNIYVSTEEDDDSSDLDNDTDTDDFMVGDYSEGEDDDYDPRTDKDSNKKQKKLKRKLKHLKLNDNKEEKDTSVSLKLSDIEYGEETEDSIDLQQLQNDFPVSANHLAKKERKKQRKLQQARDCRKPNRMLNGTGKRTRENNHHYSNNHQNKKQRLLRPRDNKQKNQRNDISSHLNEMMKTSYSFNTKRKSSNMISPSGDIVPTSNISASFKKSVSKSAGSSKLSKLHRDHRNSILARNIAAKKSNTNQFRKSDRSKSGNFKKRNGGAVILPTTLARRNRINQNSVPTIPKFQPKISKIPTKPGTIPKKNNVMNKLKQKLPQRRNKFDNTLFKNQHKKQNQYNHKTNYNNFGHQRNVNNISGSTFRDCHIELFSKILKWIPNHVESALNETKIDLTPMGDEYENAIQYKILFEPFLLEEVRAQIAATIQEKKHCRLIKREVQDTTYHQRNKNKQYQISKKQNKHQILYDTTKIVHYNYNPSSNLSTVKLQPIKHQYSRLSKTYYNHDLVLLVQDMNLTKHYPSNSLNIENIINTSILGIVKTTNDKQLFEIYINAENTSYRTVGNLCAIIYLCPLITVIREYRCLSTMVENVWASKITKPKSIYPVDGITLQNIRDKQLPKWMRDKLNEQQLNAVSAALCRENNMTLIKGPPGTGKTTTIVALINAALLGHGYLDKKHRPKILVCAPSNAAIDTVIKRTYKHMKSQTGDTTLNIKMVRIGSGTTPQTVAAEIHIDKLLKSLDPNFKEEALHKELKKLLKQKEELTAKWKKSRKLVMNGGNEEDKKREKYLADKLRANQFKKAELEGRIQMKPKIGNNFSKPDKTSFIREQDIVFSTLSASASSFLNSMQFDLLIIDESTQACELSTVIPFQLNIRSIVLVGDEKQLPATVISNQCETFGYSCSFFERCLRNNVDPYLLTIQYRMHPEIRRWPSSTFYENKLVDAPNIINDVVPFVQTHIKDPRLGPYAFFDVYQHQEEIITGKTYTNRAELDFILRLLDYMSRKFYSKNKSRWNGNVGIVTPYRGQVNLFRKHLEKHQNKLLHRVVVDTVESFQGSEKDIILFSCVRSQREAAQNIERANLGFLSDLRRLNVALTRARLCCFIVGNSHTLKANKTWKALIRDAHYRGCIYKVGNQDHKAWLTRPSSQFISTLQETKNTKKMSTINGRKHQSMDIDDDTSSVKSNSVISANSHSSSSSIKNNADQYRSSSRSKSHSRSRSHHHKANNRDRHKKRSRHNYKSNKKRNHQKQAPHRLTNAEIARILNIPEPPSDPRRRRR